MIYGASGFGYAVAHALMSSFSPHQLCSVVGFIDDFSGGKGLYFEGIPIYSTEEWRDSHSDASCIISVSESRARRRLVAKVIDIGGKFETLYDNLPNTTFPSVNFGKGCYIHSPIFIGPLTSIGNHVQLMPMCSIGHDVTIGDYCTICPSCTISGYVVLEPDVFLGAGTTIVNGKIGAPLVIGRGVRAAAGSVITKSVPAGMRLAGNPARSLREIVRERIAGRT